MAAEEAALARQIHQDKGKRTSRSRSDENEWADAHNGKDGKAGIDVDRNVGRQQMMRSRLYPQPHRRYLIRFVLPPTGRATKEPWQRTKSPTWDAGASRPASPHLLLSTTPDTLQCTRDTSATEPAVRPSPHIHLHSATSCVVTVVPSELCSSSEFAAPPRYAERKPTSGHCGIRWRTFHTSESVLRCFSDSRYATAPRHRSAFVVLVVAAPPEA
jgi:hypothetical protein